MDTEELVPKITATFKLPASAPTNEFNSSPEEVAIEKIDQEEKRRKYIRRIKNAVDHLFYQEGQVIIKRYLNEDDIYDYEVYNEFYYSERKYNCIKTRAFYKTVLILRIEIYKKEGEAS